MLGEGQNLPSMRPSSASPSSVVSKSKIYVYMYNLKEKSYFMKVQISLFFIHHELADVA
jgi:hypothetical protein